MELETLREKLRSELWDHWIFHLTMTYRDVVSDSFAHLCPPVIQITDDSRYWGIWNPETRVISLNCKVLLNYDWDVVEGVFTHEIAHQLVSDKYPQAASEAPHGPTFQKVCKALSLNPIYCGATVNISEYGPPPSPFGPQSEQRSNPLLDKIKKLLALSHSPEQHEATAALAKASELMIKHNIDSSRVVPDDLGGPDFERWRINLETTIISKRTYLIACIIQNHFFASTMFCKRYNPSNNSYITYLDLIGRPSNLPMAQHVYHYLVERCEALWEQHRPQAAKMGEKGRGAKNNFISALLNSFSKKLASAEKSRQVASVKETGVSEPTAGMILAKDADLNAFIKDCYPKFSTSRSSSSTVSSPFSVAAGKKAGQELSIYAPVGNGQSKSSVQGYLK
jgi:hypothetical protein